MSIIWVRKLKKRLGFLPKADDAWERIEVLYQGKVNTLLVPTGANKASKGLLMPVDEGPTS